MSGVKAEHRSMSLVSCPSFGLAFRFQLSQPLTQDAFFVPTAGLIADDGGDGLDLLVRREQQRDREGDRERTPIPLHSRDPEHLGAVTRATGPHDLSIPPPVPASKAFRNDQVEGAAKRLLLRIPEDPFGGVIPQQYGAVRSRRDDRVAGSPYQSFVVD
jgi:hypothetical protein